MITVYMQATGGPLESVGAAEFDDVPELLEAIVDGWHEAEREPGPDHPSWRTMAFVTE